MRYLKKFTGLLLVLQILFILSAQKTFAVCPVCTVAVGVGVGLSRYLGIDDSITGLWIGGLTVSMIMWTINWLNKKKIIFKGRKILIAVFYYLLIVVPLYYTGVMGHPYNRLWGMDKLLIGIIVGSITFTIGGLSYLYLKKKNNDHAYFPFQKVVMPVSPLILFSIIFWIITKK